MIDFKTFLEAYKEEIDDMFDSCEFTINERKAIIAVMNKRYAGMKLEDISFLNILELVCESFMTRVNGWVVGAIEEKLEYGEDIFLDHRGAYSLSRNPVLSFEDLEEKGVYLK